MSVHTISIQIPTEQPTVEVSSLAELMKQTGTKVLQLREALDINHRTAQRRIKEPETITLKELLALSKLLKVSEHELVSLIRDEYLNRPAAPATAAPAPDEEPEKKAPAKKAPAKKPAQS